MASNKRSARQKQVANFMASLGGLDDVYESERRRSDKIARHKETALRSKACESKNRYRNRMEAEDAIASCAEHGRRGLRCYRCKYCNGWHLTSKPG